MKGSISPIAQLVRRRRALGLSQQTIAERAGLTQTYLSKIEREAIDPRLSTVQEIARAETLELVLVPAELLPSIRALLAEEPSPEERPLFVAQPD